MSNFFRQKEKNEKEIKREIKKSYKRVSNNLLKRLSMINPDSMTYDYLRQTAKFLENEYKRLNKRLNKSIEKAVKTTIEDYTQSQVDFYSELCKPLSKSFQDMFSKVNKIALGNIISGKIYGDNIKLSKRLWGNHKKTMQTINDILTDGFIAKKGSKEIARDLEIYVNPDYKQEYDKFTIHPKSRNKVEFNSYRLANTYINHAYQTATKESAKENPFIEEIEWLSGTDNNVCELCTERNHKRFPKDKIPLDHPLGRCTYIPVMEDDLEEIAKQLKNWVDGGSNEKLDNWFNEYEVQKPNRKEAGASFGAYNDKNDPYGKKRDNHANMYYESVRHRDKKIEISKIAQNTGFNEKSIERAYNHIFINEYELDEGIKRFDPDYDMACSWSRLREGKDIQEHDLIMLKHEILESYLMQRYNLKYREAHKIVEVKYNYRKAVDKFNNRKEKM